MHEINLEFKKNWVWFRHGRYKTVAIKLNSR